MSTHHTSRQLSLVAQFDDITRYVDHLSSSNLQINSYFRRLVKNQELFRKRFVEALEEIKRLQDDLNKSFIANKDLENKLYQAQNFLDKERKLNQKLEKENDLLKSNIFNAKQILDDKIISNEIKEKFAFLDTVCEVSEKQDPYLDTIYEINSTGSLLSQINLSISKSEDDLDLSKNRSRRLRRRKRRSSSKKIEFNENDQIDVTATAKISVCKDIIKTTTEVETVYPDYNLRQVDNKENCDLNQIQVAQSENLEDVVRKSTPKKKRGRKETSPLNNSQVFDNIFTETPVTSKNKLRQHQFAPRTNVVGETCTQCGVNFRFGRMMHKCVGCRACVHDKCRMLLPLPCIPAPDITPSKNNKLFSIQDYAPSQPPMIPALIVHCINEIEHRGLKELGLYRIPGSELDVKSLKNAFLSNKGPPNLKRIDTHVLCGTIKMFLRSLREPLITYLLWDDFSKAVENGSEKDIRLRLIRTIALLPQSNRDTLAFLIMHFQKVAHSAETKMTLDNLAIVLGPTVVGHSEKDPNGAVLALETSKQKDILLNLLKIPYEFWKEQINIEVISPSKPLLRQTPSTESLRKLETPKRKFFGINMPHSGASSTKRKFFESPDRK